MSVIFFCARNKKLLFSLLQYRFEKKAKDVQHALSQRKVSKKAISCNIFPTHQFCYVVKNQNKSTFSLFSKESFSSSTIRINA